jgi:hypothetical protein
LKKKKVKYCILTGGLLLPRNGEGVLELVWTMQELDTELTRDLARYSGEAEGYLAGSGPDVAASWEARRWSLHLRNLSRQDSGYYECQVGERWFRMSSLVWSGEIDK